MCSSDLALPLGICFGFFVSVLSRVSAATLRFAMLSHKVISRMQILFYVVNVLNRAHVEWNSPLPVRGCVRRDCSRGYSTTPQTLS